MIFNSYSKIQHETTIEEKNIVMIVMTYANTITDKQNSLQFKIKTMRWLYRIKIKTTMTQINCQIPPFIK